MTRFHALLAIAVLSAWSTTSQAQSSPASDAAFARFMVNTVGAGQNTVTFATTGTPLATTSQNTIATDGTATPSVSRTGTVNNPAGNPVAVTAKALIPVATLAPLLIKGVGILAGTGAVIGTGIALYDLAREVGYRLGSANGQPVVDKLSAGTAPTDMYQSIGGGAWRSDGGSACNDYKNYSNATCTMPGGITIFVTTFQRGAVQSQANCIATYAGGCNATSATSSYTFVGALKWALKCADGDDPTADGKCYTQTTTPASMADLQNAIASKSGWPTSSAMSRAIAQASDLAKEQVQTSTNTVTGPATSPGTTTTTTNADGTKQVVTNTYNHTYQGDKITTTVTTTTQNINSSNVTTGTTTTTGTAPPNADGTPSDTVLPAQPTLYTKKYPHGPAGVWAQKKSAILATPIAQLPTTLMPVIPAAGSYPSWPIPLVIGQWNFGTFNASPAPIVWDFLKVCVMVTALFMARALIFGG